MSTACFSCKKATDNARLVEVAYIRGQEVLPICDVCHKYARLHGLARTMFFLWLPALVPLVALNLLQQLPDPALVAVVVAWCGVGYLGCMHYNANGLTIGCAVIYSICAMVCAGVVLGLWAAAVAFLVMLAMGITVLNYLQSPRLR